MSTTFSSYIIRVSIRADGGGPFYPLISRAGGEGFSIQNHFFGGGRGVGKTAQKHPSPNRPPSLNEPDEGVGTN